MHRITLLCVGFLKESYWREAVREYEKRLKPFAKIVTREVKKESLHDVRDKERILSIEAERIEKIIPKNSIVILLDREGRELSSEKLSEFLQQESSRGEHLCFIIGGPLGIAERLKGKGHYVLSFSHLTFTHQIARVLLLEQLYRALTVIHGKVYHY